MVMVESRWILEGYLARMNGLLKRRYVSHSHLLVGGVVLVGSAGECLTEKAGGSQLYGYSALFPLSSVI